MTKRGLVDVVDSDLRALLFWATIGMRSAEGGSYSQDLEHIINNYADYLGFKLPCAPRFKRHKLPKRAAQPGESAKEGQP